MVDVGADGGTENAGAPSDETGGVGEPLVAAAPAAEVPDAMNTDTRLLALALLRLLPVMYWWPRLEGSTTCWRRRARRLGF